VIWVLLTQLVFAQDIHAVEEGQTVEVTGPAVWMTEDRYRLYVADSRKLEACNESLGTAIVETLAANDRAIRARDIAITEFGENEKLIDDLTLQVADLGAQLDQERLSNARVRQQRNVAWAIAGGFLAASTAATTIALTR
jgi:hypothetical protein